MYYLLKCIKFLVRKNKTLKKYWKMEKNTGKVGKSQGILSARKSGNPVTFKKVDLERLEL